MWRLIRLVLHWCWPFRRVLRNGRLDGAWWRRPNEPPRLFVYDPHDEE